MGEGDVVVVEAADAVDVALPGVVVDSVACRFPLLSKKGVLCLPGLKAGLLEKAVHSSSPSLNSPSLSSSLSESRLYFLVAFSTAKATILARFHVNGLRAPRRLRLGWSRMDAINAWLRSVSSPPVPTVSFILEPPVP